MTTNPDILMLFDKTPGSLPLYEAIEEKILAAFAEVDIKVGSSQVSFYSRHMFAAAWPPHGRIKNRPPVCAVLTFGLERELKSSRILQTAEPYPNRWTHHMLVATPQDLDAEVMGWLAEAYTFARTKTRKKRGAANTGG